MSSISRPAAMHAHSLAVGVPYKLRIMGLNIRFCTVIGKRNMSRYLVGWDRETTGNSIFARYSIGWEWYKKIISVTIWMVMGQHDLAGNDLDGNGTLEFSQKRPKSQLPWFYRGKSTAGIFPKRALKITSSYLTSFSLNLWQYKNVFNF